MVEVVGELKVQDGFQEKANCPLDLDLNLNLNLTHFLTMPQAAGKNADALLFFFLLLLGPKSYFCKYHC